MADEFKALIAKVATGASLTRQEAAAAFDRMMSGEATPSQMGALLMALRVRVETVDEITGAVTTMRAKMLGMKEWAQVWVGRIHPVPSIPSGSTLFLEQLPLQRSVALER